MSKLLDLLAIACLGLALAGSSAMPSALQALGPWQRLFVLVPMIWWPLSAIRTGELRSRNATTKRDEHPIRFWIGVFALPFMFGLFTLTFFLVRGK